MSPQPLTVFYAGGGSGGHIFPAVAIAEQIEARAPGSEHVFLVSDRPLDAELMQSVLVSGRRPAFHALGAKPFAVRPKPLLDFVRSWRSVVAQAGSLLQRDHPVLVVGTGGFVAAPALVAAKRAKLASVMVNLDAAPGKANRFAAARSDLVFAAADGGPSGWKRTGPIVRRDAVGPEADAAREALGLDTEGSVLFVSGGSQGASTVNEMMIELLRADPERFEGWQLIHQCGKSGLDELRAAYREAGVGALVKPVFAEVGLCWGAADVALGRGGAGTVAEAWANRVPLIVMPYPWHRDQHQALNAGPLESAGAAVVCQDRQSAVENASAEGSAGRALVRWLRKPGSWSENAAGFDRLPPVRGAETVAEAALGLLTR